MVRHRFAALAIVATFSTVLRISVIPELDRRFNPPIGDFSILSAGMDISDDRSLLSNEL